MFFADIDVLTQPIAGPQTGFPSPNDVHDVHDIHASAHLSGLLPGVASEAKEAAREVLLLHFEQVNFFVRRRRRLPRSLFAVHRYRACEPSRTQEDGGAGGRSTRETTFLSCTLAITNP